MVLSSHYLDGIGRFRQTTLPSSSFEKELKLIGYTLDTIQPCSFRNRHLYIYQHPQHRTLYAVYSPDHSTVITAYHPTNLPL